MYIFHKLYWNIKMKHVLHLCIYCHGKCHWLLVLNKALHNENMSKRTTLESSIFSLLVSCLILASDQIVQIFPYFSYIHLTFFFLCKYHWTRLCIFLKVYYFDIMKIQQNPYVSKTEFSYHLQFYLKTSCKQI